VIGMLRNFLLRLLGKQSDKRQQSSEATKFLDELKASLQSDFQFLISSHGFTVVHEEYVGRGACFLILENGLMRLRVSSGGGLGGYDWSVGDNDAELLFEMGSGWLNMLRFVNDKLGGNESLPRIGLKSWEPTPFELLRDMYARLLATKMPDLTRLFQTYGRIERMPEHPLKRDSV
jgi:hypothetical protein